MIKAIIISLSLFSVSAHAGLEMGKTKLKKIRVIKCVEGQYLIANYAGRKIKLTQKDFPITKHQRGDVIVISKDYIHY